MTITTIGILEHFITHPPLKSPTPIGHHSPFLSNPPLSTPSQPWTTTELLSLRTCLFWTFHVNGILQHVVSRDGLLSQGIKFSRQVHVVVWVSTSCLAITKSESVVRTPASCLSTQLEDIRVASTSGCCDSCYCECSPSGLCGDMCFHCSWGQT